MYVTGNDMFLPVHLPESERVDLELNYAARDFYYIPIQMTSADTSVKPRAVGQASVCICVRARAFIISGNLERRSGRNAN